MKVLLDNGHGWDTSGKRSPVWSDKTQLLEWKWTREIVALVNEGLIEAGFDVVILTPETNDVSLPERVSRANKYFEKDNSCFGISIHANAYKPNMAGGWEVWTSKGQTESDVIAEFIFKEAEKHLPFVMRKDTRDGDSDKEENFYIIHKSNCPFVLTENGFMDNEQECKYMLSREGMEQIAKVHIDACINYRNFKQK